MRLKKEAKTSLQAYKDQSLLRRRFGDDAVRLYNLIDSGKTAQELISLLGMTEERFIEIIEFMNNNAMVSIVQEEGLGQEGMGAPSMPYENEGKEAGAEGEEESQKAQESGGEKEEKAAAPAQKEPFSPPESLSPLERTIYEKYGEVGVKIYNMIDGEKTAEEILRQTGISEAKLVEILEFMDEQGIIKLEKPLEGAEEKEKPAESKPALEPRFKPMIEEEPEAKPFSPPAPKKAEPKEEEKKHAPEIPEDIIPVDVPVMAKLSLVQKALMFAELSTKFPKGARKLIELIDGKRDFVELSLASGFSLFDIDAILAYFGKKGFISFSQLSREEIKKKYGEDGFAIYKRFGRDGLLLYEMIGKEASLRDIIVKSRFDPDRAIDILIFIHKVLGLDIPIDRNILYRQLGLRK
jgi:DNA-directed RNA polymerase specialized sigma subunit